MNSVRPDELQIYWRVPPDDFQEQSSQRFFSEPGRHQYEVELPTHVSELRIDPFRVYGQGDLHSVCFRLLIWNLFCQSTSVELKNVIWSRAIQFKQGPAKSGQSLVSIGADSALVYGIGSAVWARQFLVYATLSALFAALFLLLAIGFRKGAQPLYSLFSDKVIVLNLVTIGIILLIGAFAIAKYIDKKSRNQIGLFSSTPSFSAYLVDRQGQSLSNKPGGLALMIDPYTIYRTYPSQSIGDLHVDSNGFRGSEVPSNKYDNAILLGGSTAFGYGALSDHDTIDIKLNGMSSIHFINMGTIGFLIGQEVSTLVHFGIPYKPKYVISLSGFNDIVQFYANPKTFDYGYSDQFEEIERRLRRLAVQEKGDRPSWHPTLVERSVTSDQSSELAFFNSYSAQVKRLDTISRAMGAKFVLFLQPYVYFKSPRTEREDLALKTFNNWAPNENTKFNKLYERFIKHVITSCQTENIHCVDLNRSAPIVSAQEEMFFDTCHLRPPANQIVATSILQQLKLNKNK